MTDTHSKMTPEEFYNKWPGSLGDERDTAFEFAQAYASHVLAAERERELDTLLHRAFIVLKGLSLAVEWELAPSIMEEIRKLCREYESRASQNEPDGAQLTAQEYWEIWRGRSRWPTE